MKAIKTSVMAILCVGLFTVSCTSEAEIAEKIEKNKVEATETSTVNNYGVDVASSKIMWKGTMVGVYSHDGTINLSSGNVTVTDGVITGGDFVVDMNTITPTDENYSAEHTAEMLVGHLGADDFFSVANYPTAALKITAGTKTELTADLTIRDKTEKVIIKDVVVSEDNGVLMASGNLTFDRQKFGVSYSGGKDKVLSDDIELKISLAANKK